jgi:hypothetical protein
VKVPELGESIEFDTSKYSGVNFSLMDHAENITSLFMDQIVIVQLNKIHYSCNTNNLI